MSGLDGALGHGVRDQEEIELPVDHFGLFDEAVVDVGALRRVVDEVLAVLLLGLLEESLADTLVHDDQCDLGSLLSLTVREFVLTNAVLEGDNLVELSELLVNDLFPHRVTDTVTVDENMLWHFSIEVPVAGEGALEVVRQDGGRDDLLSLNWLGTGLCVVLAEVGVVSGTEANGTLLSLMANINSYKHGLI